MCTRLRQEFCVLAALWHSTRPKLIASGETTCSPSSHVGPHLLTWTFANVLCQGSAAKQAVANIDSFWGGGPYITKKDATKLSDAELQAEALKLPPALRCLAQAVCRQKTTKYKPDEYFKLWRSSAYSAKGVNTERWQLLQSFGNTVQKKEALLCQFAPQC